MKIVKENTECSHMKVVVKRNEGKGWNNNLILATDSSGIVTGFRLNCHDVHNLIEQLTLKDLSDDDHGELTVEIRGIEYTFVEPMWRLIHCALHDWLETHLNNTGLTDEAFALSYR